MKGERERPGEVREDGWRDRCGEELSGSTTDQIHPIGDSIRRRSPQINLNPGRIGDGDDGAQAAMEGDVRR